MDCVRKRALKTDKCPKRKREKKEKRIKTERRESDIFLVETIASALHTQHEYGIEAYKTLARYLCELKYAISIFVKALHYLCHIETLSKFGTRSRKNQLRWLRAVCPTSPHKLHIRRICATNVNVQYYLCNTAFAKLQLLLIFSFSLCLSFSICLFFCRR